MKRHLIATDASTEDARPDVLAELQLEWFRMSTVGTS